LNQGVDYKILNYRFHIGLGWMNVIDPIKNYLNPSLLWYASMRFHCHAKVTSDQ